jgi:acylphosphatase
MERRQIRFGGRVQGVGFRATARSVASQHPITGWVRNEEDGDVLLEVQGERGAVEAYLSALREKMRPNILSEASATTPVQGGEAGFQVRH